MIGTLLMTWAALLAVCWLGWQLLRQNGRILLRLDDLEKRLDALAFGDPGAPPGLALGSAAPEFDLPDLTGQHHTLNEYRGRPVLLVFFNPNCGFCRELLPRLSEAFASPPMEERGSRDSETQILIVTTGDPEQNRALFGEHKLDFPVLLQKEMEVAAGYNAHGTPSGYLINPAGKISSGLAMGAESLLEIAAEPRRDE